MFFVPIFFVLLGFFFMLVIVGQRAARPTVF